MLRIVIGRTPKQLLRTASGLANMTPLAVVSRLGQSPPCSMTEKLKTQVFKHAGKRWMSSPSSSLLVSLVNYLTTKFMFRVIWRTCFPWKWSLHHGSKIRIIQGFRHIPEMRPRVSNFGFISSALAVWKHCSRNCCCLSCSTTGSRRVTWVPTTSPT